MNTSSMLEENDGHEISNERSREDEQNQILTPLTSQGGYNCTNRRRVNASKPKNMKGRGANKTKVLKQPIVVDVNEHGQPIGDSERPLSSLIGCLARDPRRLPLDCWDWRYISQDKKDRLWEEVKVQK